MVTWCSFTMSKTTARHGIVPATQKSGQGKSKCKVFLPELK